MTPSHQVDRFALVVPVKRLDLAKTRLADVAAEHRPALALAFALDTTAAALACPLVGAVVVVTDEQRAARELTDVGALVVRDEPDAGLNPALLHGAAVAGARHPELGVGALSADLPGLRPDELAIALDAVPARVAAFVRDEEGTGTTLLVARRGADFVPAFGPGSAAAHLRAGAVEIAGELASLRGDVDTPEDLERALAAGVGPRTHDVVRRFAALGSR